MRIDDENDGDYNKEWNKRAVVTAAALAARDYEGADRAEVSVGRSRSCRQRRRQEARNIRATTKSSYNATAIAALGLLALYLKDQQPSLRDTLLRLASHQHLSVLAALGRNFIDLARVDPRLPRSFIRIVMAACIHPFRADNDEREPAQSAGLS